MWKADLMTFYMAIAQKAAWLVLLLLKLLVIYLKGPPLGEPMLKRMPCFQIIFQLFFLGYGIYNVICEPNTEWNPIIVALMYVIWIGVLIWEGFKLYIAGKKLGPQPTNNNNQMIV
jgi:hypothetical protein